MVDKIYTIGHSTHPIETFVEILRAYAIEQLVDVRTIPKSRRNPQFGREALAASLTEQGIAYCWIQALGGLRSTHKNSPNKAWRNKSFRGYADHMQTPEFAEGLQELLEFSRQKTTVMMCAEVLPWRCHRSLIGDALLVRGVEVEDIMSATSSRPHRLTSFAKVEGTTITYPGNDEQS